MKTQLLIIAIILSLMTYLCSTKRVNANNSASISSKLAYFSVQQLGRDFQLTWATNYEENNTRLELQKSFNERQFETLALFKGADRNTLKAYAYTDTMPFQRTAHEVKIIYYRLKQVDKNEVYTFSKVITIVREPEGEVKPTF